MAVADVADPVDIRVVQRCHDCAAASDTYRCAKCRERRQRRARELALGIPADPGRLRARFDVGPDPAVTLRLRLELQRRRAAGRSFLAAWGPAVQIAVRQASPEERGEWATALARTSGAWAAAFDGDDERHVQLGADLLA